MIAALYVDAAGSYAGLCPQVGWRDRTPLGITRLAGIQPEHATENGGMR